MDGRHVVDIGREIPVAHYSRDRDGVRLRIEECMDLSVSLVSSTRDLLH